MMYKMKKLFVILLIHILLISSLCLVACHKHTLENIVTEAPSDTSKSAQTTSTQKPTSSGTKKLKSETTTSKVTIPEELPQLLDLDFEKYISERLEPISEAYDLAFIEPATGYGFQIKSEQRLRAASSIKVFIMAATFQKIADGKLTLDKTIAIDDSDLVGGSGIINGSGLSEISVRELIFDMMVYSDNTASNILIAENGGLEKLNNYAKSIGCNDTHFGRLFMHESDGDERENYTTSADLVRVLGKLSQRELVSKEYDQQMIDIMKEADATLVFSEQLPQDDVVSSYAKGGELPDSRSCVNVIETKYGTYVVAGIADHCNNESVVTAFSDIGAQIFKLYKEKGDDSER